MTTRSPLNALASESQRKAEQSAEAARELRRSLSAGRAAPIGVATTRPAEVDVVVKEKRSFAGSLLLWFIIIALIAWAALYLLGKYIPLVQKVDAQGRPTGQVDGGKALLGAIIIALIIVIIIWLVKGCSGHY